MTQTGQQTICNVDASSLGADIDLEILRAVPQGFSVDCQDHANWVVRKISEARAYAERVKQWADREAARAAREEETLLFLFGRQLEAWTEQQIEQLGGKRKSVPLPAGTVGFRSTQSKIVIDDEGLVLSWAKANCTQAVTVVERLSKSVFNEFVEKTGEVPDSGVHVEPAAERFFVK